MYDPLTEAWGWSLEPCGFETISKFAQRYPRLAEIMKERNPSGNYIRIELLICTRPPHKSLHQVFGLFLVDKEALAACDPCPIEEDFLVVPADTKHPMYYSGMGRRARRSRANPHRDDLQAFARAYGGGGRFYGCVRHGKQWRLRGHYRAIADPMFESDPRFRAAVDRAVERARIEIDLRAAGAM